MQILPIMVSLSLISLIQATKFTRMPKPKLFYIQSYNTKNIETFTHKSPEERRKLPMFPRTYKKFVISLDQYKVVTPSQNEHSTKKPLVRKLVIIQDKKVQEKIERPKRFVNNYDDHSHEPQIPEYSIFSEEESREPVEENSKEASKEHDDSVENHDIKSASNVGHEMTTKQDSVNDGLKNMFTLKPAEDNTKNNDNLSLNTPEKDNESDVDEKEYIFINLLKKDKITTEEPEEFVTTEEPEIRVKRSDNVIQEENLGTTVSGYKYNWRDTRLTNNLAFKNINS